MDIAVVPVILCGGSGSRLWPLSTPSHPKPFHALAGRETLFQQALRRASQFPFTHRPIVVASAAHEVLVLEQLAATGLAVDVVLERQGHDTCVAALLGALRAQELHGAAVLAILASDQHIPDADGFASCIGRALPAATDGALVVFGVAPRGPSPAFGYIVPASGAHKAGAVPVGRFVEKPGTEQADILIHEGALWNSGNFVSGCENLLGWAEEHAPALLVAARNGFAARAKSQITIEVAVLLEQGLGLALDRAIVERVADVRMIPMDLEWSDVGTWDEVRRLAQVGSNGAGVFVHSSLQTVIIGDGIAHSDLIVVATPQGVLVTRVGQSEALKLAVANKKT